MTAPSAELSAAESTYEWPHWRGPNRNDIVAEDSGYDKLKALALSHLAVVAHCLKELDSAETYALRSNSIARAREYTSIVFRNCFYLREIALAREDETAVRSYERTLKTYLSRVEADLPEAIRFRARLAGEDQ